MRWEKNRQGSSRVSLELREVYKILGKTYGPQGWWPLLQRAGELGFDSEGYHPGAEVELRESDRFEIAVGAVLTQNTSWWNVRKCLSRLIFSLGERHRPFLPDSFREMKREELAELIRSSGYYNQKTRKLKLLADFFLAADGVPLREDLLGLWGIGPETADSILLYAWGQPYFVIDAYTVRILSRMTGGMGNDGPVIPEEQGYESLQSFFHECLEADTGLYGEFHALFVFHAKEYCRARNPRCNDCSLKFICNYVEKSNMLM